MPEEQKKKKDEQQNQPKSTLAKLLPLIVLVVVVAVSAGLGLGMGRIFAAKANDSQPAEQNQQLPQNNFWYYDLEPIVANLDEPGASRYVRAGLTLAVSGQIARDRAERLFSEKKPILNDWLSIYLASLSLADVQGDRNQRVIQSQIAEAFNEMLFSDDKPMIERVLFKDFSIQ